MQELQCELPGSALPSAVMVPRRRKQAWGWDFTAVKRSPFENVKLKTGGGRERSAREVSEA